MQRAIIVPPNLAGAALDELKDWLAINTPGDDVALFNMLHAASETCEAFTGQMPVESECEQILPATRQWQGLASRPVQAVTALESLDDDGTRLALDAADYEFELAADGTACVRLLRTIEQARLVVRFIAGLAPDWDSLPSGLQHGILRLSAHNFRERDGAAAKASPPAAVAALWQPWRRMRVT